MGRLTNGRITLVVLLVALTAVALHDSGSKLIPRRLAFLGISLTIAALTIVGSDSPHPAAAGPPGAFITVNSTADNNVRDTVLTLREGMMLATDQLDTIFLTEQECAQVSTATWVPFFLGAFCSAPEAPGAVYADRVTLPATLSPSVELTAVLPALNTGNDTVRGSGLLIQGVLGGAPTDCFTMTSNSNAIQGLRIHCHGNDIFVNGGSDNLIGGGNPGDGNILTGQGAGTGVRISGALATGNRILANYIGVFAGGSAADLEFGVAIQGGASGTIIGGAMPDERNIISGNLSTGVSVTDSNGTHVAGNYIGLGPDGLTVVPNGTGVTIGNGMSNVIGGSFAGERNVISGNTGPGVFIAGGQGNTVVANYIGTESSGSAGRPNGGDGIRIEGSSFNTIGGTTEAQRNVISANLGAGVVIVAEPLGSAVGNNIIGNYIGAEADGVTALGNATGVLLTGQPGATVTGNFVGGGAASANVISANGGAGVHLSGAGVFENHVLGNRIGTDKDGEFQLGNNFFGVRINSGASDNVIGSPEEGAGNIISGNGTGIRISDPTTSGNRIQSNAIGTNFDGAPGLGNVNEGVYISNSPGNTIGGTGDGQGNVIQINGAAGVRVQDADAVENSILRNSIDLNGGLGIQLQNGGNEDQAAPVLTSAVSGTTRVRGTLSSAPNTAYRIEFFASEECDPSGEGEGAGFLGAANVTTSAGGTAVIDVTVAGTAPPGSVVTATATDPDGNTSEFSNCVTAATATPTPTTPGQTPTPTPTGGTPTPTPGTITPSPTGQTPTPTATPTPSPEGIQGDADCDGDADSVDALHVLRDVADIGQSDCIAQTDVNCDGDRTSVDALGILRYVVGMPQIPQNEPCADIGEALV